MKILIDSRIKLLLSNIVVYGFGTCLNKVVPFFLLPVVISMLNSSEEYGKFDIFNTIVSMGLIVSLLGIGSGVFKEYFSCTDSEKQQEVVATSIWLVSFSCALICISMFLFRNFLSTLFFGYVSSNTLRIFSFAIIAIFLSSLHYLCMLILRLNNKKYYILVIGFIQCLLFYLLAIPLLKYGFKCYSLIFSTIFSLSVVCCFLVASSRYFFIRKFSLEIAKKLLFIGIPIMPTAAIYWAFNSIDRIIIAAHLGLDEVGYYSIGAKVASISQIFYLAFAGGWQYFSFSTMNDKDQVALSSKIFSFLLNIVTLFFIISLFFYKYLFYFLFGDGFDKSVDVFPYLFLSPLFLIMFQSICNQFVFISKSYFVTVILFLGLIINLFLNIFLIHQIGLKGVAISTLSGYAFSTLIACGILIKLKMMFVTYSSLVNFIILIFAITCNEFLNFYYQIFVYLILILLSICILLYNIRDKFYEKFKLYNCKWLRKYWK